MTFCGVSKLVEAFKHKQVGTQAHKAHSWQILRADKTQVSNGCLFPSALSLFILVFFPVAAPCSICSAASWRDLETSKNSSKYQSSLRLPYKGDYHMRYGTAGLSWTHFALCCSLTFFLLPSKHSMYTVTNINALFIPSQEIYMGTLKICCWYSIRYSQHAKHRIVRQGCSF